MKDFEPKIDSDLSKADEKGLSKKRYILSLILISGFILAAVISKSPFFEIILSIAIVLSVGMYIKWRKVFVSTYTKKYVENKDKNIVNNYFQKFYLDYSWKDSLKMFLILVVAIIIMGFAIYYLNNSHIF